MFYNPFGDCDRPYRPILKRIPFVFLQHGVTKDDMSAELCSRRRPIVGFVTSSERERESIINGAYGYEPQQVWLTGLPRFDVLRNTPKRKILLMPTWRRSLMAEDSQHLKTNEFVQSEYFSFYNRLINNESLLAECRIRGYRIVLALHPNFREGGRLFQLNDVVELIEGDVPYAELFSEGDILVTDYSSTAFDFAYLRKPVVYAQFDSKAFFSGAHSYTHGYYDYERDGFGEVVTTSDEMAATLIAYLSTACRLKPKYRRRIDDFFAFDDRNNCTRVVSCIQKLLDNRRS